MKIFIVREKLEPLGDDFSAMIALLNELLPWVRVFLLSDMEPGWIKNIVEHEKKH